MTFSTDVVIGIDIGTTSSKAVARPASQRGTPYVEQPTPWHTGSRGQTEMDPYRLVNVAVDLIGRVVRSAESRWGPVRVRSIGVAGLAESGALLDAAGRPVAPVIAWFDHRGGHEMERMGRESPGFAARFERTTGLPWSSQASIAKLMWLRASGHLAGPASAWLSVPEWIVFALGGEAVREPSLASRTGLIDQGTGDVWPDALAAAGLPSRILPGERPAGFPAGHLGREGVPSCAAGAVLTVAGHDHPVAASAPVQSRRTSCSTQAAPRTCWPAALRGRSTRPSASESSTPAGRSGGTCCLTRACCWPGPAADCCCGAF
jgi:sugar (pentulose or hexulose) kinase